MIGRYRRPVRECAHNLLDNSDFRNPVNQRGQTSYTNAYCIDRWWSWNGESGASTITSSGITVSGSDVAPAIFQYIEGLTEGATYTFAAQFTDGVEVASFNYPANNAKGHLMLSKADNGCAQATIYANDATVQWAALYEGSYTAETLPPYVPKRYAAELLECQRYFYIPPNGGGAISYVGYSNSATNARITIPLPVPMRATPSITIDTLSNINIYTGTGSRTCTDYSINNIHRNGIAVNFTASGLSEWAPCVCRLNTNVYISAEL